MELADDNVYVAHSLRLSSALLAAGKPHEFLPLSGMTHMANDEIVARKPVIAPDRLPTPGPAHQPDAQPR